MEAIKGYIKITVGFVVQEYIIVGDKHICINQNFVAGDGVSYEDNEGNPVKVDTTKEQYQPFEMKQPHITKTEGGLIFTCPSCQGHRLECCEDGPYNSEILHIDEEGDFDYDEISASGEVDRYQCLECGYILAFDDKPDINLVIDNEDVVEWIKENCKE